MTNGPIERYKEALELNKSKREKALDDATAPGKKKKGSKKKKNPYLHGTPNYHRWEEKHGKKK